jgi:hypothetical protein
MHDIAIGNESKSKENFFKMDTQQSFFKPGSGQYKQGDLATFYNEHSSPCIPEELHVSNASSVMPLLQGESRF